MCRSPSDASLQVTFLQLFTIYSIDFIFFKYIWYIVLTSFVTYAILRLCYKIKKWQEKNHDQCYHQKKREQSSV